MIKTLFTLRFGFVLLLVAIFFPPTGGAAPIQTSSQTLRLPGGTEVPLSVFAAKGKTLLIWLPSESGVVAAEHKAAAELAKSGIEVWLPDMHAAYFLPIVPSSMAQISRSDVARLIALAQQRGKNVYLATGGSGAALALQAAAQLGKSKNPVRGAILFSPNLFVGTPDPGDEAKYLPVASRTRLPIFILQPEYSPWKWRVDALQSRLSQGGSQVKVKFLPGVRDRFYYRENASPPERALALRLPQLVLNALKSLEGKH